MKPIDHIVKIISAISRPANIRNGRIRQFISLEHYADPMVFILHDGEIGISRTGDQLLMTYAKAPIIIGLNYITNINAVAYIQACSEIQFEITPLESALEIIEKKNLWKSTTYLLMNNVRGLLETNRSSVGLSSYQLVCINLQSLMSEKDNLHFNINACEYIVNRTGVSRSRVMKIISDLKTGGYIKTERGILIDIIKLPDNY